MASRDLDDLHPLLRPLAIRHVNRCSDAGIDLLIYCTYRSNREQADLYAQGRTKPGKIVTRAKPGESDHNFTINDRPAAKAYDCVPLINGKPDWSGKHPAWETVGNIGMGLGLNWYGKPGSPFFELFHFCLPKTQP